MSKLLELASNPIERARRQYLVDQREFERAKGLSISESLRELTDPPTIPGQVVLRDVSSGGKNETTSTGAIDPVQDRQEREARLRAICARQGFPTTLADRLVERLTEALRCEGVHAVTDAMG